MTPEFRVALYKWNFEETFQKWKKKQEEKQEQAKNESGNGKQEVAAKPKTEEELRKQYEKDSIPRQLQLLFARLQLSEQRAVKTKVILKKKKLAKSFQIIL